MSVLKLAGAFWVAAAVVNVVWAIATVVTARLCHLRAHRVKLGAGPGFTVMAGGTEWVAAPLFPLGASVRFATDEVDEQSLLERTRLSLRLVINFAPWIAAMGLALLIIGPARAAEEAASGWSAFFDPFALGARTQAWVHGFVQWPFHLAVGALAAKLVAVNLLPLPPMAGGQPLLWIVRRYRQSASSPLLVTSLIVILLFVGYVMWKAVTAALAVAV